MILSGYLEHKFFLSSIKFNQKHPLISQNILMKSASSFLTVNVYQGQSSSLIALSWCWWILCNALHNHDSSRLRVIINFCSALHDHRLLPRWTLTTTFVNQFLSITNLNFLNATPLYRSFQAFAESSNENDTWLATTTL